MTEKRHGHSPHPEQGNFSVIQPLFERIIQHSLQTGTLTRTSGLDLTSCNYCNKQPAYDRYTHTTYEHFRGDDRYDRPIFYAGVRYNVGAIQLQGVADLCVDCDVRFHLASSLITYIHEHHLPVEIRIPDHIS